MQRFDRATSMEGFILGWIIGGYIRLDEARADAAWLVVDGQRLQSP